MTNKLSSYDRAKVRWGMASPIHARNFSEDNKWSRLVSLGVGKVLPPSATHRGIIEIVAREIIEEPTQNYFHTLVDLSDDHSITKLTPSFEDVALFLLDFIGDSPLVMFDKEEEKHFLDEMFVRAGYKPLSDKVVFCVDDWIDSYFDEKNMAFDEFMTSFAIDLEQNRTVITGTRQYVDLLTAIFIEIERIENEEHAAE